MGYTNKAKEIHEWVEINAKGRLPNTPFTQLELGHITECLEHLYHWYHNGLPVEDFLQAVLLNDFNNACCLADSTNVKALVIYALFIYNRLPSGYRAKARKEFS